MNKSKFTKIISIIICSLLVLVLLFTLVASAFAEQSDTDTASEYIPYISDNGAIIEHRTDSIDSSFSSVVLYAKLETLSADTSASIIDSMKTYLASGYTLDSAYAYMVMTKEANETFGVEADTLINPGVFTSETVVYIPVPDEMVNYKQLDLLYASYTAAPVMAGAERVEIDGKVYLKTSGTSIGYLALCHGVDEAGNPVMLKFYEKGLLGSLYNIFRNFWGLIILVILGTIYVIWFFNPNRPRKRKPTKGDEPLEVSATESEPADDGAPGEEPVDAKPENSAPADQPAEQPVSESEPEQK